MMCCRCIISCAPFSCSAARAAPGNHTPNAKATASPELRLILLRMFCFVFITLSFFLLIWFLFVVAANAAFANLLHWLLSFVGLRRLHINVVSNQPPGLLVIVNANVAACFDGVRANRQVGLPELRGGFPQQTYGRG